MIQVSLAHRVGCRRCWLAFTDSVGSVDDSYDASGTSFNV